MLRRPLKKLRMEPLNYDVVISGMSLAAMSVAYEAAISGKSVLVINNRDDQFTRNRRLVLGKKSRRYLIDMLATTDSLPPSRQEDVEFLQSLKKIYISIKNIEKFIYRRLKDLQNAGRKIDIALNHSLEWVDLASGDAEIQSTIDETANPYTLKFKTLVGADGVGRHAHGCVRKNLTPELADKIGMTGERYPTAHVFAELILTGTIYQEPFNEENLYSYSSGSQASGVFVKPPRHKHDLDYVPAKFLGSLPNELLKIEDNATQTAVVAKYITAKAYAALSRAGVYCKDLKIRIVNQALKRGRIVDKSPQFFKLHVQQCKSAFVTANGHRFILAGDAYRTSEYRLGHGGNNAFDHARALGDVFCGQSTLEQYSEHCEKIAKDVHLLGLKLKLAGEDADDLVKSRLDELREDINERCQKNTLYNQRI